MSGVSSSIVNFTTFDFLRRADKISALQSIKTEHESAMPGASLRFPKHHKHGKITTDSARIATDYSLQCTDVERIVKNAFLAAYDLIKPMINQRVLKANGYGTIDGLSRVIRKRFHSSKIRTPSSQQPLDSKSSESESDQDDDEDAYEDQNEDEDDSDEDEEESDEDEGASGSDVDVDVEEEEQNESLEHIVLDSSDISFKGMRVKESIEPAKANSYFKVQRNSDNTNVYIHKQTAAWVLTNDKPSLSSDRLQRVTQTRNL